jgi:dolichol kinase
MTTYRDELARKAIHLTSALCPLIYLGISRQLMLGLAVPVMLLFLGIDWLRRKHARFRALYDRFLGQMMRTDEQKQFCGASFVMIAVVLCTFLYPKPIAVAALFILSISDSLASLVGRAIGGPSWFGKSLAGSGAFLLSALIIVWRCVPESPVAGVAGAVVATVVEALPLRVGRVRVDDNLSVPLSAGVVIWALQAY